MLNFANLEQRLNARLANKLANAVAVIGVERVEGVFETQYAGALDFASGASTAFQCAENAVFSVSEGEPIQVLNAEDSVRFSGTVRSVESDGTGWLVLRLSED